MRERQYEERRLQEFIDALNREAVSSWFYVLCNCRVRKLLFTIIVFEKFVVQVLGCLVIIKKQTIFTSP